MSSPEPEQQEVEQQQEQEGTFKDPAKEGAKQKPLNQVVKDPKSIKKIPKDNGKAKASDQPKPEIVDWKSECLGVIDSIETMCLNLQIQMRNVKVRLNAREKGLKVQEQPMG